MFSVAVLQARNARGKSKDTEGVQAANDPSRLVRGLKRRRLAPVHKMGN